MSKARLAEALRQVYNFAEENSCTCDRRKGQHLASCYVAMARSDFDIVAELLKKIDKEVRRG